MAVISQIKATSDNVNYNIRDDYSIWGGRNLLKGSSKISNGANIHGWYSNGTAGLTMELIEENGKSIIHFSGTPTGKYVPSIRTRSRVLLEWGQTYIVSCDLKFDKEITRGSNTPLHFHMGSVEGIDEWNLSISSKGGGVNNAAITPSASTVIPANTWQHYTMTVTTNSSAPDASYPYPTIDFFVWGSNRTVSEEVFVNGWLKNWKIEKGNKATDWSPAPEDIARFIGNETIELYSE